MQICILYIKDIYTYILYDYVGYAIKILFPHKSSATKSFYEIFFSLLVYQKSFTIF